MVLNYFVSEGDWTKSYGFKLHQEKFRLHTRKNFLARVYGISIKSLKVFTSRLGD